MGSQDAAPVWVCGEALSKQASVGRVGLHCVRRSWLAAGGVQESWGAVEWVQRVSLGWWCLQVGSTGQTCACG